MDIDREKERIEEKKKKLLLKEKLIQEKEKKLKFKRSLKIGEIAVKAGIDGLGDDELLGAFLEIGEKAVMKSAINDWLQKAEGFKSSRNTSNQPISIKFQISPPRDLSNQLKGLNFRWNSFRKEFYGYGQKEALEALLKGHNAKVESLE